MQDRHDDVSETLSYYRGLFDEYGHSARALGWDEERQRLRFRVLLADFAHLRAPRVLDIGCGFGDLNSALVEAFTEYEYVGVDVTPELLSVAREHHRQSAHVSFVGGDFLDLDLAPDFDFAIASGTFNQRFASGRNWEFIEATFSKAFGLCREGLAFDFLSDRVDRRHAHSYHSRPEDVLNLALEHTRAVHLRNDYMPFEFAVTAFKDDSFRTPEPVFNRYLDLNR